MTHCPPINVGQFAVSWAPPTSGFGKACDEQPLPFVVGPRGEETPRFGGEAGAQDTGVETLPLPGGRLAQSWPWSQRLFNLPRRRVNLYWRYLFETRTPAEGDFYFAEQLNFHNTRGGFAGSCPLVRFWRRFRLQDGAITFRTEYAGELTVQQAEVGTAVVDRPMRGPQRGKHPHGNR